ncbi:FecR family protein [bacterium A37T11]|nr:FecR family protein [bacterium A37T11]
MDKDRLKTLLIAYFDNSISKQDTEELMTILQSGDRTEIDRLVDDIISTLPPSAVSLHRSQQNFIFATLSTLIEKDKPKRIHISYIKVAAIFLFSGSLLFLWIHYYKLKPVNTRQRKTDICLRDDHQALLTLSNGKTISLTDTTSGIFADVTGTQIRIKRNTSLIYDNTTTTVSTSTPIFNTISTAKGSTYQFTLPDGTKVWLNTASEIKFPIVFTTNDREIYLSGEAYFEVIPKKNKPFIVQANNSQIRVFGTNFNVHAYPSDSPTTTTLLSGSVQVQKDHKKVNLHPGEQAIVQSSGYIELQPANIPHIMAWKDGYFRFENEDIQTLLQKISLWYDIDSVIYKHLPTDRFTGTIKRTKKLSQLLGYLEKLAAIKFEIYKGRVIVM